MQNNATNPRANEKLGLPQRERKCNSQNRDQGFVTVDSESQTGLETEREAVILLFLLFPIHSSDWDPFGSDAASDFHS